MTCGILNIFLKGWKVTFLATHDKVYNRVGITESKRGRESKLYGAMVLMQLKGILAAK